MASSDESGWSLPKVPDAVKTYGPYVLVGGAVVTACPFVLGFVGFNTAGIAAGSWAAKLMSVSALANGGGVAAGGIVATFQSIGAAGLGLTGKVAVGGASAGIFSYFYGKKRGEKNE